MGDIMLYHQKLKQEVDAANEASGIIVSNLGDSRSFEVYSSETGSYNNRNKERMDKRLYFHVPISVIVFLFI